MKLVVIVCMPDGVNLALFTQPLYCKTLIMVNFEVYLNQIQLGI